MSEIFLVLCMLLVLVWVVYHAVLLAVRVEAPGPVAVRHGDPIAAYVEENYGSHFLDAPMPVNRSLRGL